MRMGISEAKAKLSELVAAAEAGEDVVLTRGGREAARIVPSRRVGNTLLGLAGALPDLADGETDWLESAVQADDRIRWEGRLLSDDWGTDDD